MERMKDPVFIAALLGLISGLVISAFGGYNLGKHHAEKSVTFVHPGNVELFVTHPITGEHGSLKCYTHQPGDIQLGIDVGGHTQSYNCTRGTEHALE